MNNHVHTILAIDDDVDDLSILKEAITAVDPGAILLTAPNGAAGLEQLHQLKAESKLPCLIVLDINMPVMDGRKTYAAIKDDDVLLEVPLVVFSTSTSPLDKIYFEKMGAEYITKPVQFKQLLEVAKQFLEHCQS
ncbi:MAG TPA: response regulator [Chitinophagaceae bacterium]